MIVANFPKAQNDSLNMYTKQIESTHRQERIRRVIAKDDLPWKTWKNNTVTGRYMKTEGTIEDGMLKFATSQTNRFLKLFIKNCD